MNLIKPTGKAIYLKLSVNITQPRVLVRRFLFFVGGGGGLHFLLSFIEDDKITCLAMTFF